MEFRFIGHRGLVAFLLSGEKKRTLRTVALQVERRLLYSEICHCRSTDCWNRADQLKNHMSCLKLKSAMKPKFKLSYNLINNRETSVNKVVKGKQAEVYSTKSPQ